MFRVEKSRDAGIAAALPRLAQPGVLAVRDAILLRRLGLGEIVGAAAFGPVTTGFHELDALTTFKDAAFGTNGATGVLETAMLGHDFVA
jgi:hypothetical protein